MTYDPIQGQGQGVRKLQKWLISKSCLRRYACNQKNNDELWYSETTSINFNWTHFWCLSSFGVTWPSNYMKQKLVLCGFLLKSQLMTEVWEKLSSWRAGNCWIHKSNVSKHVAIIPDQRNYILQTRSVRLPILPKEATFRTPCPASRAPQDMYESAKWQMSMSHTIPTKRFSIFGPTSTKPHFYFIY